MTVRVDFLKRQPVPSLSSKGCPQRVLGRPDLSAIFVRPTAILDAYDKYAEAILLHEVVHLLTMKSDGAGAAAVGRGGGSGGASEG
jgi:hypothetical protein